MRRIPFQRPAAWVTIGEAFGLAWRYWTLTWDRWVLAVAAVALANGLATALLGDTLLDQSVMRQLMAGEAVDPAIVPRLMAGPLAVAVVSIVADWFLYANAVAGLRGREITLGWVLRSGLPLLAGLFLVATVVTLLVSILALLGPVGLLVMLLAILPALYVAIRCQFWVVGIFDGLAIGASIRQSWDLTRGAVLRVLGWGAAMFGLSLVLSLGVGITTGMLAVFPGLMAGISAAAGSLVQAAFGAFAVVMTAILYESQRQRHAGAVAGPYGGDPSPVAAPPPGWGKQGARGKRGIPSEPAPTDPDTSPPPPPPPPAAPWRE
jgi:hypothetical protein